jgi:hypothetical protein
MKRWFVAAAAVAALAAAMAGTASSGVPHLAGYWPMNEGRGQVVRDLSGNGLTGRLGSTTGADANDPTWAGFWPLAYLRFDGDDFIALPDSPVLEPQQLTVAAFVRGTGSPGPFKYVVSKGGIACDAGSYGLYTGFGGGLAFYVSDGSGFSGVAISPEAPATVWDGKWHVAAGTYDGTTVRMFVDGVQVGAGTPAAMTIGYGLPSDLPYIGAYRAGCDLMLKGDLAQVSIWNTALPVGSIATWLASLR